MKTFAARFGAWVLAFSLCAGLAAAGELTTRDVVYRDGDTELTGYLAYDAAKTGKRPAVIVVHEWWGLGKHTKESARKLAEMGYVGFAVDMYGTGKLTQDPKQAGEWATAFKSDPAKAKQRFSAGLETVRGLEMVDVEKVAAIGYCFGGTMVLEMARLGLDLDGVASFHGGLSSAVAQDDRSYTPRFLILHGADDPFVSAEELAGFKKELQDADADFTLIEYGNAVHSFTNPDATGEISGAKYDEKAAKRSWKALRQFLTELYSKRGN